MVSSSNIILQIIWNTCWMVTTSQDNAPRSEELTKLAKITSRPWRWESDPSVKVIASSRFCAASWHGDSLHAMRNHHTFAWIYQNWSQNDEIACWFGMNATRNETSVWGKLSFWHFWTSWDDCSRSSWHQPSAHWSMKRESQLNLTKRFGGNMQDSTLFPQKK